MELADGGFKLTYTKPLSDATLADLADKYQVRQWSYAPTSTYGGPKIGEEALTVTDATVSADRKVVTLKIDGLKPNRVVYVRSPRPFDAQDGTKLLSTEAWYTLNKLPGYVAPVSDGLYELEDGILTGGAKFDTEHAGYSGTGFVSGYGTVGASTRIDVNAAKAGDYRMALRYANGPNPFQGPKKITLIVNGTSRQITLPSTGTWPTYRLYVDTVTLNAGENTIELKYAAGDDGNVNLDSLRLAPAGTTRYEAEAATLAGGANAQTEHAGYSGLGYVGGYQNQGASTTFKVTALADGETDVTLGYANGPNPFAGHQGGEPVRQRQLREEARAAGHGRVDRLPDARTTSSSCAPGATTSRSASTRATTATSTSTTSTSSRTSRCSASPRSTRTTRSTATRWTAAAGRRSSTRTRPATPLADGKLQIKAQGGDITGGTVSAKNVVLQPAPTDGSWSATTKVSIDGTDDYIQAGLVAHASASAWAKVVVMRRPDGRVDDRSSAARTATRTGRRCPPTRRRPSRCRCTRRTASCAAATRSTTARPGPRSGTGFPLDGLANAGIGARRLQRHRRGGRHVRGLHRRRAAGPAAPAAVRDAVHARRPATRCCSTARTRRSRTGSTPAAGASCATAARSSPSAGSA